MSTNSNLIEEIRNFRSDVKRRSLGRDTVTFQLKEIDFDNGASIGNHTLSAKALHTIYTSLRVKDNFVGYKSKMAPENWDSVKNNLRDANGDVRFWGKALRSPDGSGKINRLYLSNPENGVERQVGDISLDHYFDLLETSLEDSETPYIARNLSFDPESEEVTIRLLDNVNVIDALNTGNDPWKKGYDIHFDLLQYAQNPFFERLVCTNGNVGTQYGWKANIQTKKFNLKRIQQEMAKLSDGGDVDFAAMLQFATDHLNKNNVSLLEFYQYRDFFDKNNEDHRYDAILGKFFGEKEIYSAYGTNIREKSKKWQSTADSGRNAYSFFNDLTWLASHPESSRMTLDDARQLQINASNLLFKAEMDLEDVAPRVLIEVVRG